MIGEADDDNLHDVIGGEFGWGPARHAMCDAASWLRLGQTNEACERARTAIDLRVQDGTGSLVEAKAAVDLASAELMRDNLDAAETALAPVWDITSDRRIHGVVARLEDIGTYLRGNRHRRAPRARNLVERIAAFTADSAQRALPPGGDQFG